MGIIAPQQAADNSTPVNAASVNNPINTIANEFNGNIDNSNVKVGAGIATSKLATDAGITEGMLGPGSVGVGKLKFSELIKSVGHSISGFTSTSFTNTTGTISYTPATAQKVLILATIKYTTNTNGTGINSHIAVDGVIATGGAKISGDGNNIQANAIGFESLEAEVVLTAAAHTISVQIQSQGAGTFGAAGYILMIPMDNS